MTTYELTQKQRQSVKKDGYVMIVRNGKEVRVTPSMVKQKTRKKRETRFLTYREALAVFNREIKPRVIPEDGARDKPAIGEAWVIYVDNLERNGFITQKQAANWGNPFYR